jgi:hypothetical protein
MIAQDLYKQFIANLETVKENHNPTSPEIKTSLRIIGSFLRSRSSHFEILENQEDVSVFLSLCKSSGENLVLVFNYFLSDIPVIQNKKISSSKYLKSMLNRFDKAVKSLKDLENPTEASSQFKVLRNNFILGIIAPPRKMSESIYNY